MKTFEQFITENIGVETTSLVYLMFDHGFAGNDDITNYDRIENYEPCEPYFEDANEIIAYYIITEKMANFLKARGMPVLQISSNFFWGRLRCGAFEDDPTLQDIYELIIKGTNS